MHDNISHGQNSKTYFNQITDYISNNQAKVMVSTSSLIAIAYGASRLYQGWSQYKYYDRKLISYDSSKFVVNMFKTLEDMQQHKVFITEETEEFNILNSALNDLNELENEAKESISDAKSMFLESSLYIIAGAVGLVLLSKAEE